MINNIEHLSLILPASAVAVPIFQIFIFVFLIVILPGSLGASLLGYIGKTNSRGTFIFSRKIFLIKVINFALYHFFMLAIWIATWPQIYNDVHTGYSLRGMIPYMGIMVLWTLIGLLAIYGYRIALEIKTYRPTIGVFARLYFWNILAMFVFRQTIYYYVTK